LEDPDAEEKRIRFGCGFLFGLLTVASTGIFFTVANGYYITALCIFVGVIVGLAAMKQGDEFWRRESDSWWPWRWWW
jgi:hypothetical protein